MTHKIVNKIRLSIIVYQEMQDIVSCDRPLFMIESTKTNNTLDVYSRLE